MGCRLSVECRHILPISKPTRHPIESLVQHSIEENYLSLFLIMIFLVLYSVYALLLFAQSKQCSRLCGALLGYVMLTIMYLSYTLDCFYTLSMSIHYIIDLM